MSLHQDIQSQSESQYQQHNNQLREQSQQQQRQKEEQHNYTNNYNLQQQRTRQREEQKQGQQEGQQQIHQLSSSSSQNHNNNINNYKLTTREDIEWVESYVKQLPRHIPFTSFILESERIFVQIKIKPFKVLMKQAWAEYCTEQRKHAAYRTQTLWEFLNDFAKLYYKSFIVSSFAGSKPEFYFDKDELPVFIHLIKKTNSFARREAFY